MAHLCAKPTSCILNLQSFDTCSWCEVWGKSLICWKYYHYYSLIFFSPTDTNKIRKLYFWPSSCRCRGGRGVRAVEVQYIPLSSSSRPTVCLHHEIRLGLSLYDIMLCDCNQQILTDKSWINTLKRWIGRSFLQWWLNQFWSLRKGEEFCIS